MSEVPSLLSDLKGSNYAVNEPVWLPAVLVVLVLVVLVVLIASD